MVKLSFYLSKQKKRKDGFYPVYMSIAFNGQRIRKQVKSLLAEPKNWDVKRQRFRAGTRDNFYQDCSAYNTVLDGFASTVSEISRVALLKRIKLTENYILERLYENTKLQEDRNDFFRIVEKYLESVRPIRAARTITGIQTAFNFLREFEKDTVYKLTFEKMGKEFFERFRTYSFAEKKISDNYFSKIVSVLKAFLNWSLEHDFHQNISFKKFKAPDRENDIICLEPEEFLRLYHKEFDSRRLTHVRDFYCFGCATGLRFSDLKSLSDHHIRDGFIVKTIQKTQETSTIPLNKFALEILAKYKESIHSPLPKISSQKFNKYIKECCQKADINDSIVITRFSGGIRTEKTLPKYDLITSHTARKTFATMSLILGVPERVVKNITGHKKDSTFSRYVNFSKKFEKDELNKVWDKI